MRITFGMSAQTSLRNIERNNQRMSDLEAQLTSSSRLNKPSDDPIGVARALNFQQSIDQSTQYLKNIDQGTNWLNSTDSALGGVSSDILRARELAVQAANGTLSDQDKLAIDLEVSQLQLSVLDLSNSKIGSSFLFSGNNSANKGYVAATSSQIDPTAYQGNALPVQREVAPGVNVSVNADAQTTFDPVFDALAQLKAGLAPGADPAILQASLTALDGAVDAISTSRSGIGAKMNRLETLQGQQTTVNINLTGLLSQVKDVDMASAIVAFTTAQTVYTASLKSASQALQSSLLDYLR